MFKSRTLATVASVLLLGVVVVAAAALLGPAAVHPTQAPGRDPSLLPENFAEPAWPVAEKLGADPTAIMHIAVPDMLATSFQNRRTMDKLNSRFPELDLQGLNFQQTIDEIQKGCEVSIVIDWEALNAAGLSRDVALAGGTYRATTLRAALTEILNRVFGASGRLTFDVADGVIRISTHEVVDRRNLFTRVYQVGDLLAMLGRAQATELPSGLAPTSQPGDQLVTIITDTVQPETWLGQGGQARIARLHSVLVVVQTPAGHADVERLLAQLRTQLRSR